ncbi:MAG TPA: hypothetical protein PKD73_15700 [Burkholderiaceae bacterium]|nr:hypothetical protein [Burkholderiaceae bacterium]
MALKPIFNFDEFTIYENHLSARGWIFSDDHEKIFGFRILDPLTGQCLRIDGGLTSPDVAQIHGERAAHCRFSYRGISPFEFSSTARLVLEIEDAATGLHVEENFIRKCLTNEPVHRVFGQFLNTVHQLDDGATVVEIGSRARSAISRRALIPERLNYIGVDILPGENVDQIMDAHELSRLPVASRVDAVFSFSVFEHLLMPWKVALEMNQLLRLGGTGFIMTHQSWPTHDRPCDYRRFSDSAWKALFNPYTGFELLEATMSDRAYVLPLLSFSDRLIQDQPNGFLQSCCLFKKIGQTALSWNVPLQRIVNDDAYPV